MKILITGALGHIGSKLIRDLSKIKKITKIYLIDDLRTQRYNSLMSLPKKGKFKFYDETLSRKNLDSLIKISDFVVHLAAITDAASSFGKLQQLKKNNLDNTKLVTEICATYKKKLIFISSTSVYGSNDKMMFEDENNLNPQSPYAKIKISEEKYINKFSKHNGLNAVILRFGTILGYSIGMRFHTAVNKFCYNASLNKPVTVWKTALNQKRPYLGINDACAAIIFFIKNPKLCDGTFNVLTSNLTVKDIIDYISLVKKIKINFVNNKIMNQLSYEVSILKIKKLNFKFKDNLKLLIKEEMNYLANIDN